jgi:hypothetical protein
MALKVGDKCPQCREGLLERTELGLACNECSWDMEIDEVVAETEKARVQAGEYVFRPRTFKITLDDPDNAEIFLRGLILARQNNNSEYFVDLIDAVNAILEPWRAAKLHEETRARDRAAAA